MFWFFGHKPCGILAPQPGIEPTSPAFEGGFLTTGTPGKSLESLFKEIIADAPSTGAPKYIKQILPDLKGEIENNIIIVWDFNTPL